MSGNKAPGYIPLPVGEMRVGTCWFDVVGEGVLSAGEEWLPEPAGLCTLGPKDAAEVSVGEAV